MRGLYLRWIRNQTQICRSEEGTERVAAFEFFARTLLPIHNARHSCNHKACLLGC
jgi:hypothetical protein